MEIKGFIETSLVDWDGMVCCVLFLPGCNFRCPFCYNHILVKHPEKLESVPWERVERYLEGKRDWIDGVVITGGEPTIHQGLKMLLVKIKKSKFKIKIDTNGYRPEVLEELIAEKLADFVAMDVKAPLDGSYSRAAGVEVDTSLIERSIRAIIDSGLPHEFRTTVVPGLHTVKAVEKMGKSLKGSRKWAIQQFVPDQADDPALRALAPLPESEVREMQRRGEAYVDKCFIRGLRQVAEAPPN
jgi:pyruvate formate lyase activating enzyme